MLLLIISGESGVGKTTIEKKIANDTSLNFTRIISVTTRKQRKDEKPNFDYYFISKEKFKEELKKNNFIEHISYDDNYYGIYRRDIDFLFDKKKNCVVSAGVEGTKQIKRYFLKKNLCVVSIWLKPEKPEKIIKYMLKRKTNFEEIKRRLVINEKERKENNIFDYTLIVRENFLEETIEEIKKIIFNFQV